MVLDENLPKDISLKEMSTADYPSDSARLSVSRLEITESIAKVRCEDASQWKISAMGAKPCGGPAYYIAYPEEMEEEIAPKIARFAQQQSSFNQKYGRLSDCVIAPEPTSVQCKNGKVVLVVE